MHQTCRQCSAGFEVTDEDLAFYDKVSPVFNGKKELIPPPTLCPECRCRRRMTWRNERSLYVRPCELCKQNKVSAFAPDSPFHAYCHTCYTSDNWDPFSYGRTYDFSKDFRSNFRALMNDVPMRMLYLSGITENCDYVNFAGTDMKNCYLVFNTGRSEDCYYSRGMVECKDCTDTLIVSEDELCYECVNCNGCYNLRFSQNCAACTDSAFLFNCQGCRHCFGCTNLVQKEYYLYNKPCTPEEFNRFMSQMGSVSFVKDQQEKFAVMRAACIHRSTNNINTEDCTGDYITSSKNCKECFEAKGAEDCKWLLCSKLCKDSYDLFGYGYDSERLYENTAVGLSTSTAFSFVLDSAVDSYFCLYSQNIKNCFGCIGLRHAQYCIFNRQYTKEEYEDLVPKIIEQMRLSGDWGEFFEANMSPFSYNETVAQEYMPMTKDDVLGRGWKWRDETIEQPKVERVISAATLPDTIDNIPDDILNWAVECEATHKPFRIIKQELDFYRKMNLPIPRRHPDQRHKDRMALCNPRKIWQRPCGKCGKQMQTSYAPERLETVYCEECYLHEVY